MRLTQDIGIDLGTTTVLVYIKEKGIVLHEPSIVAVNKYTGEVVAAGKKAKEMLGRTPEGIVAIKPLKDGVISDYIITEKMLKCFLEKVSEKKLINPRLMICVPSGVTEVEKRAVINVANNMGARKVHVIEEPLAAAIGAGIDITKPSGNMIIDVGGGTTDIAVVSLGGIVKKRSIKIAGNTFDEAISKYIKKKYNFIIGDRTAEKIKMEIGCVSSKPTAEKVNVSGRNFSTGMPEEIIINTNDIYEALKPLADEIVDAVITTIEELPPELSSDISLNGIYLTGGGSLIYGLDKLIQQRTKIEVRYAENPEQCVVYGTGKALDYAELLEAGEGIKIKKR